MSDSENREWSGDEKREGGEVKLSSSPLFKWLDNFFYHYKWHTVVALVVVFAIVLCSVQMCSKTEYDAHIMYAGGGDIRMTAKEGDVSQYQKLLSAMKQYTPDFNGDGERNLNLLNLYIPSAEEIAEIEKDGKNEVNLTLVASNTEQLKENLYYGAYQICFLSEHLLTSWTKDKDNTPLAPISPYIPEGKDYTLANEYGVYLSSTPLYDKPGFELLPEDTVICMRRMSEVSTLFNKADNEENFRRSEELLRELLK